MRKEALKVFTGLAASHLRLRPHSASLLLLSILLAFSAQQSKAWVIDITNVGLTSSNSLLAPPSPALSSYTINGSSFSADLNVPPSYGPATAPPILVSLTSRQRISLALHSDGKYITMSTFNTASLETSTVVHNMSANPLVSISACRTESNGFVLLGTPLDPSSPTWIQFYGSDLSLDPQSQRVALDVGMKQADLGFVAFGTASSSRHNFLVTYINDTTNLVQYTVYDGLGDSFGEALGTSVLSYDGILVSSPRVLDFRATLGRFAICWIEVPTSGSTPWERLPKVVMAQFYRSDASSTKTAAYALAPTGDESNVYSGLKQLRLFETSGGRNIVAAWMRTKNGNIEASFTGFPVFYSASTYFVQYLSSRYSSEMTWPAVAGFEVAGKLKYMHWTIFSPEKNSIITFAVDLKDTSEYIGGGYYTVLSRVASSDYSTIAPGTFYMNGEGSTDAFFHSIALSTSVQSRAIVASRFSYPAHTTKPDFSHYYLKITNTKAFLTSYSETPVQAYFERELERNSYSSSTDVSPNDLNVYAQEITTIGSARKVSVLLTDQSGKLLKSWTMDGLDCRRPTVFFGSDSILVVWDEKRSDGSGMREVKGQFFMPADPFQSGAPFLISAPSTNASMASISRIVDLSGSLRPNGFVVTYVDVSSGSAVLLRYIEPSSTAYLSGTPISDEILVNPMNSGGAKVWNPQVATIGQEAHGMVLVAWIQDSATDQLVLGQYVNYLPNTVQFMQPFGAQFLISPENRLREGDPAPTPGQEFSILRSNLKLAEYPYGARTTFVYQEQIVYQSGNQLATDMITAGEDVPSRVIAGSVVDNFMMGDFIVDSFDSNAINPCIAGFDGWMNKFAVVTWQRKTNSSETAGLWWRSVYPTVWAGLPSLTTPAPLFLSLSPSVVSAAAIATSFYDSSSAVERRFTLFYATNDADAMESNVAYQLVTFLSQYDPELAKTKGKTSDKSGLIVGLVIGGIVLTLSIIFICLFGRKGCCSGSGGGGGGGGGGHSMDNSNDYGSSWNNDSGGGGGGGSDFSSPSNDSGGGGGGGHSHDW